MPPPVRDPATGGPHTAHTTNLVPFIVAREGERPALRRDGKLADIAPTVLTLFGLPVARAHTHETSGLGAAMDAAVGLGFHPDVPAAAAAMGGVGEVRDPDPATHALYDELYRGVYRQMYGRLQPLYREIRRITGYPPR